MPAISDTAYPRLEGALSASSLAFFTPTEEERRFAQENFGKAPAIVSYLLMLK